MGEVGRNGAPGRREIGHGNLAERAIKAAMPSMDEFPYVHVKLLPQSDWTDVMRQYIHKGMAAA